MYIHVYTYIYIHIHTSANRGREVFSRGCSRRPRASGWTRTGQICCGTPWDRITVRGSCIGYLRAKQGGRFRGPGRVPRGGVRQIGSAQPLQTAEKSGCPVALGCPECGPPIAAHGECFSGTWHRFQCLRVSFQEIHAYTNLIRTYTSHTFKYHHIRTYTYIYVFIDLGRLYTSYIHTYTYIYLHILAYTCIYIHIHTYTYISQSRSRGVF